LLQFADMNMKHPLASMLALALLGCQPDETTPYGNDGAEGPQGRVLRLLALGDSYTIGEAVTPSARWPNQLVEVLRQSLPEGDSLAPAQILATTGWTTADLKQGMDGAGLDTTTWDLVSLLIGVNDQYQGLPIEEYTQEFEELLDQAIDLAGGDKAHVFVVSIPDYGYTPFGQANQASISTALQKFNDTCRVRTLTKGVAHFNITDISQQWPDTPGLVAVDGLHPSGVQYGLWVDSFAGQVADQLD
jgi:lysophospholipase L1-like esterase